MRLLFCKRANRRLRRHWGHRSRFFVALILLLITVQNIAAAQTDALPAARNWLLAQQNENGSWSDGFTQRGGGGITAEAVIALWAAGVDVKSLEPSPTAYLKNFTNQNATTLRPALAAKLTLAAVLLDEEIARFSGVNLIEVMVSETSPEGMMGSSTFEHCLITLALIAAEQPVPTQAVSFIQQNANPDGGWGFAPADASDTNTTALCLQALMAAEDAGESLDQALAYLREQQNSDGGWAFQKPSNFSTASEPYSTSWVVMALNAADQNLAEWGDPLGWLREFQTEDGAFQYHLADPIWATVQALPALAGVSLLDIHP